ncbi:MAG: glucose/galactose MFS transporter, partial [Parabacteroides sp.]|nr:glucose/galactose MFS transporter [Parabacteroides sp.]
ALFMIGRLTGSAAMRWLAPRRLLAMYALLSALCMGLVITSWGTLSLYALYLSFFFMSIMFPTIFALGLEGVGADNTKKASSFIVMGVAGGAFSPMLMGYIGETTMAVGFVVPLCAFLYILYFALRCK